MKTLIFIFSLVLLSQVTWAETEASDNASVKPIGPRYIKDTINVPLRSGKSAAYRVINTNLNSGDLVTLLEVDKASGYSLVRLSSGQEGWLQSQYLQRQKTAAIELKKAQALISQLTENKGSSASKILNLDKENNDLKQSVNVLQKQLAETQAALDHIRSISDNAMNLSRDNQRLLKDNESIKNQRDMLQAENNRLKETLKRDDFINGAIAVILGIIATLLIQYFYKSRKRSEWA